MATGIPEDVDYRLSICALPFMQLQHWKLHCWTFWPVSWCTCGCIAWYGSAAPKVEMLGYLFYMPTGKNRSAISGHFKSQDDWQRLRGEEALTPNAIVRRQRRLINAMV